MIEYYGVTCDLCGGNGTASGVNLCEKCNGSGTIPILNEKPGLSTSMLKLWAVTMLVAAAALATVLVHFR